MEKITRNGDIITIKSEVVKTIDLGALRAELVELEAIEEPSDEDLLAHGKMGIFHPYYDPMFIHRKQEIKSLLEKYDADNL